jgi:SAM-dependent methyltransferase
MLSKFGYNQMTEGIQFSIEKENKTFVPELRWLYHAVDTDIFRPLPEEVVKATKQKYGIAESAVVFTCVARNQPRKNYPILFKAFADFVEKHNLNSNDVVLWLHTLPKDVGYDLYLLRYAIGVNPRRIIDHVEWEKMVRFTPDLKTLNDHISPEEMAKVYNMSDYFVLPTVGEGFGVPTVEAMACGIPPIITDCTTSPELTNDGKNGMLVDWELIYTSVGSVDRFFISREDLINKLETAYFDIKENNGEMTQKYAMRSLEWARENCSVDIIVHQLHEILKEFWDGFRERGVRKALRFGEVYNREYVETTYFNAIAPFSKVEYKTFIDQMPEEAFTVLEVGAGSGEGIIRFNREGYYCVGCDIALEAIKLLRERGLPVKYADVLKLRKTFKKDNFDVCYASHVIEHIEDWKKALSQMWKVAKVGIGLAVPRDNMHDASHVRNYKEEEIAEMIKYLESLPNCKEAWYQPVYSGGKFPISFVVGAWKEI